MQCVCGNVAMYDLRWAERWAPDWNKREVIMCDVATCHVSLPPDTCICCPVTDTHNHRPSIRAVAVIVYYEVGISSECQKILLITVSFSLVASISASKKYFSEDRYIKYLICLIKLVQSSDSVRTEAAHIDGDRGRKGKMHQRVFF